MNPVSGAGRMGPKLDLKEKPWRLMRPFQPVYSLLSEEMDKPCLLLSLHSVSSFEKGGSGWIVFIQVIALKIS